jgi:hypothetical protein
MTDFVDAPPSFKERFDEIEDDLRALKRAVGAMLLSMSGQPVNVDMDLLEKLGYRASPILPASKVVVAQ